MSNATKLPNDKREQNYRRQNAAGHGKNKLSNRQKRRLRKHDPKCAENLERINNVAKAILGSLEAPVYDEISDAVMDSIGDGTFPETEGTNECPRCGAKGDEPCTTPKGAKAAKPHAGRE